MTEPHKLTHDLANEVLTAVLSGRLKVGDIGTLFVVHEIGPALELAIALVDDAVNGLGRTAWPTGTALAGFSRALAANKPVWVQGGAGSIGFYRTREPIAKRNEDVRSYFSLKAQMAAEVSGFRKRTAQALVGAMGEIEDNIHEHFGVHESGVVAFQGEPGAFNFVVADAGKGVLASLRQSRQFAALEDHGDALRLALTDGISRFSEQDSHRGRGFHSLFVGLASLRGRLRFASGDHALIIEGQHPTLSAARLIQKTPGRGFVVSVTCSS